MTLLNYKYCFYKQLVGHNLRVWKTWCGTKPFTRNMAVTDPPLLQTFLSHRYSVTCLLCEGHYRKPHSDTQGTPHLPSSRSIQKFISERGRAYTKKVYANQLLLERLVKGDVEFYWGFNRWLELSLGKEERNENNLDKGNRVKEDARWGLVWDHPKEQETAGHWRNGTVGWDRFCEATTFMF